MEYHKTSVARATSFPASMAKHTDVSTSLDSARNQQAVVNRHGLKPIVSTVIICGRKNLPLRGYRMMADHLLQLMVKQAATA